MDIYTREHAYILKLCYTRPIKNCSQTDIRLAYSNVMTVVIYFCIQTTRCALNVGVQHVFFVCDWTSGALFPSSSTPTAILNMQERVWKDENDLF